MGAEIDSLEIKLQANAQSANRSLDALVKKLDVLSTSLGRVNGNSLISLSNGVQRLANSMQSMKSVGTADFTRLAKNIEKLGSLDAAAVGRAASSIHRFTNALQSLDSVNVSDNAAQIGTLAKGISQLGYKSATQAINNIPKLATAMKQLMTTLSSAPKVSQNLINMTNALAKLARTGASSGRAASSLSNVLNTYTASTGRASKGTFSLASAIGKLYAIYWLLFRAFSKIGEAIDISSDLTEVQNVVDMTFGNMTYKVEEFAETSIEQFGMSELALKQYASRFQAMGSAMGIDKSLIASANSFLSNQTNGYIGLSDSMADVSLNLTKLTADMASFYNLEQDAVAEDLESIFTGQTRPLRTYGLDLTQATLQEWALKQGIDADIKSMSQAEKTMLRYQYVLANTRAAQGDFARTADTWANQVRILKQNFQQLAGVVGGVFINALKPLVKALNAVMSHIIAFAKTISNALGKIFGWKYESGSGGVASDFEDAAGSADDIADSTGDAAKNIDKMQKGIRAFDELKTISISDNDSSSGSGSGSGSGSSGSSADSGQWVEQDSIFDAFESEIDSLYKLGEYIGETLTKAMNSIDWDSIYQGAKNFGKGLAEFLNGLISPELFGATGRTIAGALNTAIYAALSFGETFDWTDFGNSIATGVNEFFKTFDFKSLAKTINVWVQGVWKAIKTAIANIDWEKVWDGIKDFLSEIDIETVEILLGAFALKYAGKLLTGEKLKSLLSGMIEEKFVAAFGSEAVKSVLSYAIPISLSVVVAVLSFTIGKDSLKKDAEDLAKAYEEGGFLEYLKESFKKLLNPFEWINIYSGGMLSSGIIQDDMMSEIPTDIGTIPELKDFDTTEEYQKALDEYNKNLPDGLKAIDESKGFDLTAWINEWLYANDSMFRIEDGAIIIRVKGENDETSWENLSTYLSKWWTEDVSPWFTKEKWQELGNNLKDGLTTKWNEFTSWWETTGIYKWWTEDVSPWFTKEKWQELGNNIKTSLSEKWDEFTTWWSETGFCKWWNNDVKPYFTKEKWKEISKGIKDGLTTKWNEFTSWWETTGIYKWWTENVAPYFTSDKWSFSGIKDGLESAWNAAVEAIKGIWNNFASWLNSKLTINIDTNSTIGEGISKALGATQITLGSIPMYKTGGFPEDGLFMANHGELLGEFSNGKTAVANNMQITQGIADAIYPAVYNAVSAAMSNSAGAKGNDPVVKVYVGDRELTDIAIEGINERTRRTGRTPIELAF